MEAQKVDFYLSSNGKNFPADKLPYIRERLLEMDDDKFVYLSSLDLKESLPVLICSIIGGTLGIDRFYIGDIGLGVLKLLTGGLCGIMWIIDIFLTPGKAKEKNFVSLMQVIG